MKRTLLAIALIIIAVSLVSGCSLLELQGEQPSVESLSELLRENKADFETVANYLICLDGDAFIDKNDGTVFVNFSYQQVSPADVANSVSRLFTLGCKSISTLYANNTISFEFWNRTRGDVSCGIACTISGDGTPEAEFQTERTEICDGWFYYYADYEQYRVNRGHY